MQRTTFQFMTRYARRVAGVVALAAFLIACSDDDEPLNPGPLPVAAVAVTPPADEVPVGEALQLKAAVLAANGDTLKDRQVSWASHNEQVATVSASGLVTTHAAGIALIEAGAESKKGSATITVTNPVPAITALAPATIQAGSPSFLLTVTGAYFVPGSVVHFNGAARPTSFVSATELRAGISAPDIESSGSAVVRVLSPLPGGGQSGSAALTITPGAHEVAVIEVSPARGTLWFGESMQLTAIARNAQGQPILDAPISFTSSNSSVLVTTTTGIVTGAGEGTATIEASLLGKRASASISVWVMQSTYDIVYERPDGSGMQTLYVVSPGTPNAPRRLLPAGISGMQPAVSYDGNRVAFVGFDAATGNRDIYVVNRDGTGLQRVTTHSAPDERPAWAPDGNRLAFESVRNGYRDIYVIDVNGTNERNLTAAPIRFGAPAYSHPSWSPDNVIAFTFRDLSIMGSQTYIHAVNADGSNARLLSPIDGYSYVEPSFSRDGSMIVFRRFHPQTGNRIGAMLPTGEPLYWFAEPGPGFEPKWAPNNQWLAFISGVDASQPTDVYVWQAGTDSRKRITLEGGANNPAWIRR